MSVRDRLRHLQEMYDDRSMAEKCLIALLLVVCVVWGANALYLAPTIEANNRVSQQITVAESQLVLMQQRERQAEISAAEDPNQAARLRIERAIAAQAELQSDIEQLAGNLVTPQSMTRLLTSILENQPGLELIRVENRDPSPMRSGDTSASASENEGQIFKHSLLLELEGDYLSLIVYLQRIEAFEERFFWDQVTFQREEWPTGRVTLELHTLSTEEGFVGV
jgi:MSHA biogenesis protein MshJ